MFALNSVQKVVTLPAMKSVSFLFLRLLLVLGALFGAAQQAQAGASRWVETEHTRLRLISQTAATGVGATVTLGLHFQLNDHWKIYWRSPGDAGFPPSVNLEGSSNAESAEILWPLPERFSILGFETLGYRDEVVLPLRVALEKPGEALLLKASVSYLACAEICIPYDADVSFVLPAGSAQPSPEAHLINRFETRVPAAGPAQGLDLARVEIAADGQNADTGKLYVTASSQTPFTAPDVYVEGPDGMAFGKPRVSIDAAQGIAVMEVPIEGLKLVETAPEDIAFTITLADSPRGAEFVGAQGDRASADTLALMDDLPGMVAEGPSLALILGFALLGGLILNLMPCVLPVLSIKLLGMVGHGGREKGKVRLSFLASAAGIVSSFLVLAAGLIALKGAGVAIGWGIQFQHPWFLVAMAMVVTVFACNLWGFFEVHLPDAVNEIGAQETHVHGLGGHFMTGALATLLATPCSAPFLGTAVGFALARGAFEILAIFAALGIGLALPYLLVAAAPGLATRMPRPGKWMVTLRRVLGFALAGTAVWLVSVLAVQTGEAAAGLIGAVLLSVTIILYAHKRLGRRYGRLDWLAVAVLTVLAFAVPDTITNGPETTDTAAVDALWQPFDERRIEELVADGKVVFVDVTADWCITCQVNKAAVLNRGEVLSRLQGDDVVALKADWTKPSDVISRYLAKFGRYGIPFNAVYGPGAPDGIALPELLTRDVVLNALDKARARAK